MTRYNVIKIWAFDHEDLGGDNKFRWRYAAVVRRGEFYDTIVWLTGPTPNTEDLFNGSYRRTPYWAALDEDNKVIGKGRKGT